MSNISMSNIISYLDHNGIAIYIERKHNGIHTQNQVFNKVLIQVQHLPSRSLYIGIHVCLLHFMTYSTNMDKAAYSQVSGSLLSQFVMIFIH